jgi:hypothetical protein
MGLPNTASRARLIAFYLPQFHPIPENDRWCGKGFTEWTAVAKAKPLFPGHYQPRLPADLGFYDLRVPETRTAQAALARGAGIEGFCYWHYWFAGKRLLERPFCEVLKSGEPDFPFCLGWANHKWLGKQGVLIEQTYPGPLDYEAHFFSLLPAFHDPRYIRVRNKPLFYVFYPRGLPDAAAFTSQWQELALRHGLEGIHFVAHRHPKREDRLPDDAAAGFSGITHSHHSRVFEASWRHLMSREFWMGGDGTDEGMPDKSTVARLAAKYALRKVWRVACRRAPNVIDYEDALLFMRDPVGAHPPIYPCIIPNWDHSPRSGFRAIILHNSTPELFRRHVREILEDAQALPPEERIVFVKSWNEWAEGNYLEPDRRFGHQYLDVLREEVLCHKAAGPNGPGR